MNVPAHIKKHSLLYIVLMLAALARLVYLFDYHEIWWDSGVYIGMAKYLWSGGTAGLWEHIRPVLWPLIIGSAWWLKQDMIIFARALEFLMTIISIVLVYALGRKWFSQRAAVLASILWSFSSIVFYFGFHEYTELPAVALVLGALLAFTNKQLFFAGFLACLAFLMKFPAGIFLIVLALVLVMQRRSKQLIPLGIGFGLPTAAFLMFNHASTGSALGPLFDAQHTIANVLGCNVFHANPWHQYFSWIVFDNALNVFALLGLGAIMRRWNARFLIPVLALVIPAAYFMQMHCREYRYLILFLPFVVLFTGNGLSLVIHWLETFNMLRTRAWICVLLAVLGVSVATGVLFYHNTELRTPDLAAERYFHWVEDKKIDGEIWSTNPIVSRYTDAIVHKIYYPVYNKDRAMDFNEYLQNNTERIGAVMLDNCGGGIICPPDDDVCREQLGRTRAFLNENFKQVSFEQSGNCWYAIYSY